MQERLNAMEDRLQATNEELDVAQETVEQQQSVLNEAGLAEDEGGSLSALSSFLERTDFSGWVAASYAWNVNDPSGFAAGSAPNRYANQGHATHAYHGAHNSFQFDEFWLSMGQQANEEHRAGFQFDIVFGETASVLGNSGAGTVFPTTDVNGDGIADTSQQDGGNSFWINQAYIEYLTPFGVGVRAGKMSTLIGYEVVGAAANIPITRGFTWALLQPISQTGVMIYANPAGMDLQIGVVNGFSTNQIDMDPGKDLVWRIGWGNDMVSTSFNGQLSYDAESWSYAPGAVAKNDHLLVLDLITEVTPADNLLLYANVTSNQFFDDSTPMDPWMVGVNLGGRVGVTDRVGLGGRFEYLHFQDDGSGVFVNPGSSLANLSSGFFTNTGTRKGNLYGITGVVDVQLVDNLTFKAEGQWTQLSTNLTGPDVDKTVNTARGRLSDSQLTFIGQLIYEF